MNVFCLLMKQLWLSTRYEYLKIRYEYLKIICNYYSTLFIL